MDRDNLNRQHPEPPPRSPQPARYIRTTSIFHKPTEEEKLSPLDPNFAQKIAMLGLKKKQQEEMDLVVDFRDFINPDTSKYAEAAEYSGGQVGDEGIERQEEEKMASLVKSPSAPTSTSHQLASLASSDNTTPTITMTTNPTPFIDPMLLDEEERIHRIATHLKTTGELVEFWGYPFEDHSVVTKDGYILGLHRIPNSR